MPGPGDQQDCEARRSFTRNTLGQRICTLLMLTVIVCTLAWNMPAGPLHDKVNEATAPIARALGLEQSWAVFAPEPRSSSVAVYAIITLRDGRTEQWTPPSDGLFLTPYRNYRWQKYVEQLRSDKHQGLWRPTAQWLVRQYGGPANVAEVVLWRTFRQTVEPGSGQPRPATQRYPFYVWTAP